MNKAKSLKLLIFLITATFVAGKAYGYAEAEQALQTTVQPTVTIEKSDSSIENTSANAEKGTHSGLRSVFDLKTNGTDDNYDFLMESSIIVSGGTVSAYGNNGCILFGHTLATPTMDAVENAKTGGSNNANVIAYPVTVSATSPLTTSFDGGNSKGNCYVIKINGGTEGTVTHTVGGTPINGTYSVGQDQAGTYQATVTFTAYSK